MPAQRTEEVDHLWAEIVAVVRLGGPLMVKIMDLEGAVVGASRAAADMTRPDVVDLDVEITATRAFTTGGAYVVLPSGGELFMPLSTETKVSKGHYLSLSGTVVKEVV